MTVCVDASLILKCLTYEPDSEAAQAWLSTYGSQEMVAPWLLTVEVASVLRRKVRRGEVSSAEAEEAISLLAGMQIRLLADFELVQAAFEIAGELAQPSVYDTLYLAVAQREACELWTADTRFARAAAARFPFVRSIKEL